MMASTVSRLESNFTCTLTSNGNSQVPNESCKAEYNSFRDHIDFNVFVLDKVFMVGWFYVFFFPKSKFPQFRRFLSDQFRRTEFFFLPLKKLKGFDEVN